MTENKSVWKCMNHIAFRYWFMMICGGLLTLIPFFDTDTHSALFRVVSLIGFILMIAGIFSALKSLDINLDDDFPYADTFIFAIPSAFLIYLSFAFITVMFSDAQLPTISKWLDIQCYDQSISACDEKNSIPAAFSDIVCDKSEVLKFIGGAMGGMLITLGVVLLQRRTHIEKRKFQHCINIEKQNSELLEKERIRNQFNCALANLASAEASQRIASLYLFYDLAKDIHTSKNSQHDNFKQYACDILCVHLRKMFTKQDNSSDECRILEKVLWELKTELGIIYSVINNYDIGKEDYLTKIRASLANN